MSYIRTLEHSAKRAVQVRQYWLDPENRTKHIEAFNRLETKEKRSKSMKATLARPEIRKKWSDVKIGKKFTEEHKRKIGEALCKVMNTPEYHERLSKTAKEVQNRPEVRATKLGNNNPMRKYPNIAKMVGKMKRGPDHWWWKGGCFEPYGSEFTGELAEAIRDRDDHLCQFLDCYLPENGRKHQVHHIDYVKKHNDQVNLITLCHPHHATTTSGDREYWTEYFQELQMQRGIV